MSDSGLVENKTLNVLIVEDDEVDQMMLRRMCSGSNIIGSYEIQNSLGNALEAIRNQDFDIVVSDHFLADGEGMDLVIANPNLPVILITGSGDEQIAVSAMKVGAVDYIIKDLNGEYLKNLTISIERSITTFRQKQEVILLNARLAEILDNAAEMIQTADLDGNILFVNKCWKETLGYTQTEDINVLDVIHPASKDHCMNLLKKISTIKTVTDEEISFLSSKGEQIFTRANILCRFDDDGKSIGTQGVFRDITERILVEKKARKSEERYQLLVESANDVIFHGGPNGRLLFINKLGSKLTGYSKTELKGIHFNKLVQKDYRKKVSSFYLNQIREGVKSSYLEFPIVRKDGSQRWVGQSIRVLIDEDKPREPSGFLGVVRDVTIERKAKEDLINNKLQLEERIAERTKVLEETNNDLKKAIVKRKTVEKNLKQSKKDYESLFRNAHDAILIFGSDDQIILEVNERACELYGFSRREFIGMSIEKIYTKTSQLRNKHPKEILSKVNYVTFETTHITKNQTSLILEIKAVKVEFKGCSAILSMNRDITEKRALDLKLETERMHRLTSLVDGQEMERNRIARDLHDGLGQVLTALIINLREIERKGKLNKQQILTLKETEGINKYLIEEVRRISNNLMPSVLQDFGLEKALNNMVDSFKGTKPALIFHSERRTSRLNKKAEVALFRIAQEAVNNAVKHSEAEEISLSLAEKSGQVTLSILDDGKGIHTGSTKKVSNSGNGLGHMKERASIIGAKFDIISSENSGTEIIISYKKQ